MKFFLLLSLYFIFIIKHGYTQDETNNNYSAEIIEYSVNSVEPNGNYIDVMYGEYIHVEAWIENTSPESSGIKTFYLLLSFSREGFEPEYYLPPQPLHLSPELQGGITYSFPVPHLLEPGKYNLNISIWEDFNEDYFNEYELDIKQALTPNPVTELPYDEQWSLPAYNVDPGLLVDNPFEIGQYDYLNIFNEIPDRHRNKGMPDLYAYDKNDRSLTVVDRSNGGFSTRALDKDDENIIIILHGWMPPKWPWKSGYGDYIYNDGDKWPTLLANLNNSGVIDDSWCIVEYDWFNDAYVKDIAITINPNDISVVDEVVFGYLILGGGVAVTVREAQRIPLISAYRSYQHGLMIARKLMQQVGLENLSNVQIISHSAGAWANLALTQYLGNQLNLENPEFNLQSIYLDPFIPDNLTLHNVPYMSGDKLQRTSLYTINSTEYQGAQAYFNTRGKENTPILIGPATEVDWEWSVNEGIVKKTDFYSNHAPPKTDPHDVPIYYYAHSTLNPDEDLFRGAGWRKSLAYKFIKENAEPDPEPLIVIKSIELDKFTYNPGESAYLTVILEDQLSNANVAYSIQGGTSQPVIQTGPGIYQTSFSVPTSTGTYALNIQANKEGHKAASGGVTFGVVKPNDGHDFAVTHMALDNTSYDITGTIKVTARVENVGTVAQSNVPILVRLLDPHGSVIHERQENISLQPDGHTTIIKDLWAPAGSENGTYTVVVRSMLSTDINPANDYKRQTVYMGVGPPFAQYINTRGDIIEGLGNSINVEGYNIKLIKLYTSYNGKPAAEIQVSKGGSQETSLCFLNEITFFDNGNIGLVSNDIMVSAQWYIFSVYVPSNDVTITPPKLFLDAGSEGFLFGTAPSSPSNISAKYTEDSQLVNDWMNLQNSGGGNFVVKISPPLDAQRKTYDFWLGVRSSIQYMELEVFEPHNMVAIGLSPEPDINFDVGEVIEIMGVFKNLGGYPEPETFINLEIEGPLNYFYHDYSNIDFAVGEQHEVLFNWNTTNLPNGAYSITVNAIVENDPYDNNSITSIVELINGPPVINITPFYLDFGEVLVNNCVEQSYQITGFNLTEDISLLPPGGFMVSFNPDSEYVQNLTLPSINGEISKEIFVKFCPVEYKDYPGSIENSSQGAISQFVSVSSNVLIHPNPPTISTLPISGLTPYSAYSGGEILSDGGDEVVVKGVVWGTTVDVDLNDFIGFTIDGEGIDQFDSYLHGLDAETTYFVKAYASNSGGTGYGQPILFDTPPVEPEQNEVTDLDGNHYPMVTIGNQVWMGKNLRTSKYSDGSEIASGLSNPEWYSITEGAFAIYPHSGISGINSDEAMLNAYGALYNWNAVQDERGLCPADWSVPSDDDWNVLTNYLISNVGGTTSTTVSSLLKSCYTVNYPLGGTCNRSFHPRWDEHTARYGTDDFGFSALPGGARTEYGNYQDIGMDGFWWTSTTSSGNWAFIREMRFDDRRVRRNTWYTAEGLSVRCLRDKPAYEAALTVAPVSLKFSDIAIGDCEIQSYQITGSHLNEDIHIQAPEGYAISLNAEEIFVNTLILSPTDGYIDQTIFVRFCPDRDYSDFGNISHLSSELNTVSLALMGATPPEGHIINLIVNPMNAGEVIGSGTYPAGSFLYVSAVPNDHWMFANWTGDVEHIADINSPITTLNMPEEEITLIANFKVITHLLELVAYPVEGGTVSGTGDFEEGEQVLINAIPNEGYEFVNWTGSGGEEISNQASFVFTMPSEDVTLTANFEVLTYILTVAANPSEGGTVSGGGDFPEGEEVNLYASPGKGFKFINWTDPGGEEISNQASFVYIMPAEDVALTANFEELTYTLTLTANPSEGGTVSGGGEYPEGEEVFLSTILGSGYEIINWTDQGGEEVSDQVSFVFTMPGEDVTLTANFEELTYTLRLVANPSEGGTVSGGGDYPEGEEVSLSSSPDTGYEFINWTGSGGEEVSNQASFEFIMPGTDITLTANFEVEKDAVTIPLCEALDNCELEFTTGGHAEWSGQAQVTYDGVDAAQSGEITHDQQTWLETMIEGPGELTFRWKVSSESGYDFLEFYINDVRQDRISGNVDWQMKVYVLEDGLNTIRWIYTKDRSNSEGEDFGWVDQVVFVPSEEVITYNLSIGINPANSGTASGSGKYEEGEEAVLTATPNEGYEFISWTDQGGEEISDLSETVVIMPANDVIITANFELVTSAFELDGDAADSGIKIFPNPALNEVHIHSKSDITEIMIVDMMGRVVYIEKPESRATTINLSHFSRGLYIVNIITEAGVIKTRLEILK